VAVPGAGYLPRMSTTSHAPETMGFGPLRITFDGRVLRPRPWTAAQSEWAAEILAQAPAGPVLELCAGAGQIGLLAVAGSDRSLVCVDLNPVACDYARGNARAAALEDRVEVREGSMEQVLRDDERFALVIADPPWVRRADVGRFPEDPVLAIDGGLDGMALAWLCVDTARPHLMRGASVLLQLGSVEQVDLLRERLRERPEDELVISEVRWCDRGVLVRLDAA
jgi:release factor glutamine methyltransferase